jgi:hypothetical protein
MKYTAYGLKISSAAFQRIIDLAIRGMKYIDVTSFVDDLAVAGVTFEKHNERLFKVEPIEWFRIHVTREQMLFCYG